MADSQRKSYNLFDKNSDTINNNGQARPGVKVSSGTYSINNTTDRAVYYRVGNGGTTTQVNAGRKAENILANDDLYVWRDNNVCTDGVMLNEGSTALPYEPYGWVHSLRKLGTSTDTITTLPADIYADGNNATVGLVGNMEQSGTPTPQNPIQPSECGERTSNLFNIATITTGYRIQWTTGNPYEDETAVMSDYIPVTTGTYRTNVGYLIVGYDNSKAYVGVYRSERTWEKRSSSQVSTFTVSAGSDVSYIKLLTYGGYAAINEYTRVNEGSTSLPLEPYGYKIPISSANTTTPVYLGEVETTRKIRKLVLTGEEDWEQVTAGDNTYIRLDIGVLNTYIGDTIVCTHCGYANISSSTSGYGCDILNSVGSNRDFLCFRLQGYQGNTIFKQYLEAQYANDTPVTVWYVLANPETAVVNEPLMKIGDYADEVSDIVIPVTAGANTLSVDTTVQPSEVAINYKGWHPIQSAHEKSRNLFDEVYPSISTSIKYKSIYVGEGEFTGTSDVPIINNKSSIWFLEGQASQGASGNNSITSDTKTVTSIDGYVTIAYRNTESSVDFSQYHVMLNTGSTALPYEPYWK